MMIFHVHSFFLWLTLFSAFVYRDGHAHTLNLGHLTDISGIAPFENRFLVKAETPRGDLLLESLPYVVVEFASAEIGCADLKHGKPLGRSGLFCRVPLPPGHDFLDYLYTLDMHPKVKSAFPDVLLHGAPKNLDIDDPNYPAQWYLEELHAELLWEKSFGDSEVRVAVIDSGIDIAHPDLSSKILAPKDTWDNDDDPSPNPGEFCYGGGGGICDEHGTAVAGIVLADANDINIIGLCPDCSLIPIKMLGDGYLLPTQGALSGDVTAFEHAIEHDAAVINNSWGYNESMPVPEPLASIIRIAATQNREGKGAVVVFAAGNEDRDIADNELSALEEVLSISATDRYGNPTPYTNKGASIDLAAPAATLSLAPGGGITENFGGTSSAAPVVSGVAAWILSVKPELTATEVRQLLKDTVRPDPRYLYDDEGHNEIVGHGLLDLEALVNTLYPSQEEASSSDDEEAPEAWGCHSASSNTWVGLLLVLFGPIAQRRKRR